MSARYPASQLVDFADALLARAGLEPAKARDVAEILVEADLLGHNTHGLALLAPYLAEIEKGAMTKAGGPQVIADFPAAVTWDGNRLPGPWLVRRAFALAAERARQLGTCTVVIRRSHHIACLAAYLRPVTEQGLMAMLTCSDPTVRSVAPHGGRGPVMTPNPVAAAWPTDGDPVILDVSMSITTNALTKRIATEGKRFPGEWAVDPAGKPTNDPQVLFANPAGTLLPIGGLDHGHKGFALGALVEALTSGLAGLGRADPPEGWTANVMLQVFDPRLFGGKDEFIRQTTRFANLCRMTPPRIYGEEVRMPGARGLKMRAWQLEEGVDLHPSIRPSLQPWMEKWGVTLPG